MSNECAHARIAIGGEPHALPPEVAVHLATCAACRQFHAETMALDGRLRAALELPLAKFRKAAPAPARRFALAASVALATLVGGSFWLFRPQSALADEVVDHVSHESASWSARAELSASELADVLRQAGVTFDTSMPVVYAMACPFHGRRVPHLVVQTPNGPMTVMLLAHEKVSERQEFSEGGLQGVLLPAGEGSVAVLTQNAKVPDAVATQVLSEVHW